MVKKLVSRSELARLAGVSAAAVTKACNSVLKPACEGKRLNRSHPVAVEYIERNARAKTPPAATGLDNLYEDVVAYCQSENKYVAARVQRHFKIGDRRAGKIMALMRVNGLVPKPGEPAPEQKQTPRPKPRGNAAVKERKKRESNPEDELFEIPEDIQTFLDWTLRDVITQFGTDARFVDWLTATQKIEGINGTRLKNGVTKGELVSRHLVKVGVIDTFDGAHIRLLTDGAKTIARRAVAMRDAGKSVEDIETFVQGHMTSHIKPVKNKIARTMRNATPK